MRRPSLRDQRGVAMMMALVTFLILSILIGELAYETGVYNGVVWRQVDQLRARLLARSGLRLALLQVQAAKKAKAKAASLGLGEGGALTDQIWKTPLVLPPPAPPGLSVTDTQALDVFGKALGLDGTISVTISGENGRINLNQMAWLKEQPKPVDAEGKPVPNPPATQPVSEEEKRAELEKSRAAVGDLIEQLLEAKRQADPSFRDKYSGVTGPILAGNIAAWIDPELKVDGDGRDKFEYYSRLEPQKYALKDAPMASESELFMVKGLDDTLANLVADNFTTQVTGGINVNDATPLLLRALIPELGETDTERVVKRRTDETQGGPFKSEEEFWTYLNTLGNYEDAKKRLADRGVKLMGEETSYRVAVTAKSGTASKTWVAKIGPLPPAAVAANEATRVAAPADAASAANNANKPKTNDDSKTLNIIYLKAD